MNASYGVPRMPGSAGKFSYDGEDACKPEMPKKNTWTDSNKMIIINIITAFKA